MFDIRPLRSDAQRFARRAQPGRRPDGRGATTEDLRRDATAVADMA